MNATTLAAPETTTVAVSTLTGAALDWAVAMAEGLAVKIGGGKTPFVYYANVGGSLYGPSRRWAQCGPIIHREGIGFFQNKEEDYCQAAKPGAEFVQRGQTPLIAAMRCYVMSKLGDAVSIPASLLEGGAKSEPPASALAFHLNIEKLEIMVFRLPDGTSRIHRLRGGAGGPMQWSADRTPEEWVSLQGNASEYKAMEVAA